MKKYNKQAMRFFQKYGVTQEDTFFSSESSNPSRAVAGTSQPPLVIDDATEEKAQVWESLNVEEQREEVLEAFRKLQPATDNEIKRYLRKKGFANIESGTISARRNDNIYRGFIVPVLNGLNKKVKRIDPITNEPNVLWRVRA